MTIQKLMNKPNPEEKECLLLLLILNIIPAIILQYNIGIGLYPWNMILKHNYQYPYIQGIYHKYNRLRSYRKYRI